MIGRSYEAQARIFADGEHELLTGWFPETVRPAHPGFYPVRTPDQVNWPEDSRDQFYAHWNGLRWSHLIGASMLVNLGHTDPYRKRQWTRKYNRNQCYQWRGLTEAHRAQQWERDDTAMSRGITIAAPKLVMGIGHPQYGNT